MFAQTCIMHVNLKSIKTKSVYCFVTVTLLFVIFYLNNTSYLKKTEEEIPRVTDRPFPETSTEGTAYVTRYTSKTKYILLWTNPNTFPFLYFGEGNSIFIKKKCEFRNCYVTSNRQLLRDYTEYDIIAFNGPQLVDLVSSDDLPRLRSFRQKYVYTNIEAAANYPICKDNWDNFFNWTWTYKLNSDAIWGYIAVYDINNEVIGPSMNMDWPSVDDMTPIDDALKKKLSSKTKAGAWFVSNCNTISKREEFVNEIQAYMRDYNLKIDVYGACGTFQCPKSIMPRCLDELEKHYYFYFAFENAISEDYVTEKILYALDHLTVPVVFGGADYSRYLPPGSFINAYTLGAKNLAKELYDIIENPGIYYRYFRWRQHYKIRRRQEDPKTDEYCQFCALANNNDLMTKQTIYSNFSGWWTPAGMCASN